MAGHAFGHLHLSDHLRPCRSNAKAQARDVNVLLL
jgi:hypothetical protein